jgi:hypothetical protein
VATGAWFRPSDGVVGDEREPVGGPVGELVDGPCGGLVASGLPVGDRWGTGLGQQVGPGAVEELAGDDVFVSSSGYEDGQVGQSACDGEKGGVEGQGSVEDSAPVQREGPSSTRPPASAAFPRNRPGLRVVP